MGNSISAAASSTAAPPISARSIGEETNIRFFCRVAVLFLKNLFKSATRYAGQFCTLVLVLPFIDSQTTASAAWTCSGPPMLRIACRYWRTRPSKSILWSARHFCKTVLTSWSISQVAARCFARVPCFPLHADRVIVSASPPRASASTSSSVVSCTPPETSPPGSNRVDNGEGCMASGQARSRSSASEIPVELPSVSCTWRPCLEEHVETVVVVWLRAEGGRVLQPFSHSRVSKPRDAKLNIRSLAARFSSNVQPEEASSPNVSQLRSSAPHSLFSRASISQSRYSSVLRGCGSGRNTPDERDSMCKSFKSC
mmetsp:Transcript_13285/g.35610  ORF Transcript_13285/g.35610 Transcript_13285/m.35610 type:complete len:312 (+) Transcript_13285:197-1132(+)